MEKEKKVIATGEPIDVMEFMEVRGGADTCSRVCIFRVGVRCTGKMGTTETVKCKGNSSATSSEGTGIKCRGKRNAVKCSGGHSAVVTNSGTSAISSY